MRILWLFFFVIVHTSLQAQNGTITGTVVDEKSKALESVTVELSSFTDSASKIDALVKEMP